MDTAVQTTMQVIGGKWKASTLIHLKGGPTRFNALKRMLPGITQRMLAQQLRELEADGVISRKVLEIVPPHVEYALTTKGATLVPILNWLAEWGESHEPAVAAVKAAKPARAAKAASTGLGEPQGWRFQQINVQSGGLTHGQTSALSDRRLVFGSDSLAGVGV